MIITLIRAAILYFLIVFSVRIMGTVSYTHLTLPTILLV